MFPDNSISERYRAPTAYVPLYMMASSTRIALTSSVTDVSMDRVSTSLKQQLHVQWISLNWTPVNQTSYGC